MGSHGDAQPTYPTGQMIASRDRLSR